MDFSKLTKQELLDKVIEQQALAHAVEHKDRQITDLQKQISEFKSRPTREEFDALRRKLSEFDGSVKKEDIETYTKKLEDEVKKSRDIANQYIRAHRDLMRIFKANLDFAISHEELLVDKLK